MQDCGLVMLLLVKLSYAKDGSVLVMNRSYSVVIKLKGLTVSIAMMLEYTVMVR